MVPFDDPEALPVNADVVSNTEDNSDKASTPISKGVKLTKGDCKTIKQRLNTAETYLKKHVIKPMKKDLDLYIGKHWPGNQSKAKPIVINKILHAVETLVHGIAFNYPVFNAKPITEVPDGEIELVQSSLAKEWCYANDGVGIQVEAKRTLKDKIIYGVGVCLVAGDTHTTETDPNVEFIPVEDNFIAKRINPCQFLVSADSGRILEYSRWCGYWELVPLEDVKENKNWQSTRDLKGKSDNLKAYLDKATLDLNEDQRPNDIKYVKIYHYYEKKRKIHAIFCDEHDNCLFLESWARWQKTYPFRYMHGPGDEDGFYGISICTLLEHPQMEVNTIRTQLANYLRMFVPRFQTGGHLSQQQEEALQTFEPGAVVQMLESPVNELPVPQVPSFLFTSEQTATQDMSIESATDQYQWGSPPSKRTPELEVQAIQSIGGARAQNDRQMFEIFCSQIAKDNLAWQKANKNKPTELKITDSYGSIKGFRKDFTGSDITGEYDLEVYVNSTSAPTNADKLKEIGYFTQAIQPLLQLGPAARPLARQILIALPDIRDVDKILDALFPEAPPPGAMPPEGALPPEMGGMPPGADQGAMPPVGVGPPPQGPPPMAGPQGGQAPPDIANLLAALSAARPNG